MQRPTDEPRYRDLTLGQFVERLSSDAPVPGGGSASAVAASLAASLVAMVADLSRDRPRYAAHAGLHGEAADRGRLLADRMLKLADLDAEAYARYAAAGRLPRSTPAEITARDEARTHAAREAAEVPLLAVEACLEIATAAESLAGRSNRNASSDLNVAVLLAEAAARGAGANVLVNLPALPEGDPFVGRAVERVDGLLHEIGRLADITRSTVLAGEEREPLQPTGTASAG